MPFICMSSVYFIVVENFGGCIPTENSSLEYVIEVLNLNLGLIKTGIGYERKRK